MIIFKLKGGLGNQMFQYAFAKKLSVLSGKKVFFDISGYSCDKKRIFALDAYKVKVKIIHQRKLKWLKKIFKIFPKKYSWKKINEINEHFFEKKYLKCYGVCYYDGYWQNQNYFQDIKPYLMHDFSLKNKKNILKIKKIISSVNSVSIHIRRGDYASSYEIKRRHGLLGVEYYKYAISLMEKKISNPYFFVFSDDIQWVKKNILFKGQVCYVSELNFADYEELKLMSYCKYNIISNSTFSWWGSYLNVYKKKHVIAPYFWYNNVKTPDALIFSSMKLLKI